MSMWGFLRQQLDRDPLEHGRLFVAAGAAVCAGYPVFMAGIYVGLPPQDGARESGFLLTCLDPFVLTVALPIGVALTIFAYGLSLFLPRHALQAAWLRTFIGVLVASALTGWALGGLAILAIPIIAVALASLSWFAFPARSRS